MVFLRGLIFSEDATTQETTAAMLKTYFATENTDLKLLQEHVHRHGSPPCITGGITTISGGITTIEGSPGMYRLSAMEIGESKVFRAMFAKSFRHGHRVQCADLRTGNGHHCS